MSRGKPEVTPEQFVEIASQAGFMIEVSNYLGLPSEGALTLFMTLDKGPVRTSEALATGKGILRLVPGVSAVGQSAPLIMEKGISYFSVRVGGKGAGTEFFQRVQRLAKEGNDGIAEQIQLRQAFKAKVSAEIEGDPEVVLLKGQLNEARDTAEGLSLRLSDRKEKLKAAGEEQLDTFLFVAGGREI